MGETQNLENFLHLPRPPMNWEKAIRVVWWLRAGFKSCLCDHRALTGCDIGFLLLLATCLVGF